MGLRILGMVFLAQAVVIGGILVFLKKTLDRRLRQDAVNAARRWIRGGGVAPEEVLIVVSHRRLAPSERRTFLSLCGRVDFRVDPGLWGGVVLSWGGRRVDCSLRRRLREAVSG